MKKKDAIQELESRCQMIRDSAKRWNEIAQNGCSDPTWPDGINLNLVRNHIIYDRKQIVDICEENGIIMPDEAEYEIPPEVPSGLFVGDTDNDRYRRISSWNETLVVPRCSLPVYDPLPIGQTSLF